VKRALIFDTETTGLPVPSSAPVEKQPKIIDLGIVEVAMDDKAQSFIITREKGWLIHPGELLLAEITKITGLKDDDLKGQPSFPEVLPEILEWFLGAEYFVAHNLPFDLGLLINELKRCGKEYAFPYPPRQICTVAHYMPVYGRRAKLTEVYERVLGKPLEQKHRALDDARALAEIVIAEQLLS
jgi:DNA polymerase III epsilon subunit-like protein